MTGPEGKANDTPPPAGPGRVALFGGPGGGAIVAGYVAAFRAGGGEVVGLLNDAAEAGDRINGHRVLGGFADWRRLAADIRFLAPLHKVIQGLGVPDARWATLIDPRAAVAADATLGPGCHVGPYAEIHPGARLGRHVGVRGGAKISHDCAIGDFAFIGLNAIACGYVEIGEGAHIAPQAAIREELRVGRYAVVGLGAVVVSEVADFAIVAGNPARQIGTVPVLAAKEA